jgi:hypothetical protein
MRHFRAKLVLNTNQTRINGVSTFIKIAAFFSTQYSVSSRS